MPIFNISVPVLQCSLFRYMRYYEQLFEATALKCVFIRCMLHFQALVTQYIFLRNIKLLEEAVSGHNKYKIVSIHMQFIINS